MINQISALELRYLVKEMQEVISAKVDKVFMPAKREIDLRLHVPSTGKRILRISLPGLIYLSEQRQDYPTDPHGFAMFLRKRIGGARIREISQHGSERIMKILFETKDQKYLLIIELFSKGNVILCDEELTIINPLERQIWKDRAVKTKETYVFPEREFNIFELDKAGFTAILEKSSKTLVKKLAMDLTLGGVFAEEVCLLAGIDKENKTPSSADQKKVYEAFKTIIDQDMHPTLIMDGEKIIDILPIDLLSAKDKKEADGFNKSLDTYHSQQIVLTKSKEEEQHTRRYQSKYEKILDMQGKQLKSLQKKIEENHRKGELIYEHFTEINSLLKGLEEAKTKLTWKEIREKAIAHPKVLDMDIKNKNITIELD